jgi:hypothetical protein
MELAKQAKISQKLIRIPNLSITRIARISRDQKAEKLSVYH